MPQLRRYHALQPPALMLMWRLWTLIGVSQTIDALLESVDTSDMLSKLDEYIRCGVTSSSGQSERFTYHCDVGKHTGKEIAVCFSFDLRPLC